MSTLTDMPTTYDQILPLLIGKDEITIGNNTVATWSTVDAAISVLLHGHEIIRVYGDGTVTVRHCGYPTRTTLDRINRFIQPIGWKANLRNGAAYVDWMMLHTDEWVHLTQV